MTEKPLNVRVTEALGWTDIRLGVWHQRGNWSGRHPQGWGSCQRQLGLDDEVTGEYGETPLVAVCNLLLVRVPVCVQASATERA